MAAKIPRARVLAARRFLAGLATLLGIAVAARAGAQESAPRLDVPEGTIECGGEPIALGSTGDGSLRIELSSGAICTAAARGSAWEIVERTLPDPERRSGVDPRRTTQAPSRCDDLVVSLDPDRHRFAIRRDRSGDPGTEFGDFGSRPGLLNRPRGLAVHDGRIFIGDTGNHRVQIFTLDGALSYAVGLHQLVPREGNGRLHYPTAVAVSADGSRLFVAEPLEGRVQVFRARTSADPPPDPASTWQRVDLPSHYGEHWALSGRWLLIAEPDAERVSLYDVAGDGQPALVSEIGGAPGDRLGRFRDPGSVRFIPAEGALRAAVLDRANRRVQVIEIVMLPGTERRFDPRRLRVVSALRLDRCTGELAVDPAGTIWVSGEGRATPLRDDPAMSGGSVPLAVGESLHFAGGSAVILDRVRGAIRIAPEPSGPWRESALPGARPESVAALSDGTLVIVDGLGHRVLLVDRDGGTLTIGGPGVGAVEFHHPRAVAVDPEDRIWVLDHGNHRGQVIDRRGNLLRAFGSRSYLEPIRRARERRGAE